MSLLDTFLLEPARLHVWIAYRTDGVLGSGTVTDPYDGSTCARFDAAMRLAAARAATEAVTVHLGPSPRDTNGTVLPFQTAGYSDSYASPSVGWRLVPNMNVVGSGMDNTWLRLTVPNPHVADAAFYAIGHPLTDEGAELFAPRDSALISELTIDCALEQQPASPSCPYAAIACNALRLMGSHARVHRVKAVNWGTKSLTADAKVFHLVTALAGSPPWETANAGIEDCVALLPSDSSRAPVTVFYAGAWDASTHSAIRGIARSPYLRNNFVDSTSVGGRTLGMTTAESVTLNGPTVTFTGKRDHLRSTLPQRIAVSAPTDQGSLWNTYVEATPGAGKVLTWAIGTLPWPPPSLLVVGVPISGLAMNSCRGGVVEGNQVHNTWHAGPVDSLFGAKDMVVRNNIFKNVVTGPKLTLGGLTAAGVATSVTRPVAGRLTVTTALPHNLTPRTWVKLTAAPYSGYYQVHDLTETTLTFLYGGSGSGTPSGTYQVVEGVDHLVLERNVVELCDLDATEFGTLGLGSSAYPPMAFLLGDQSLDTAARPPFAFGTVILRHNHVRYVDGRTCKNEAEPDPPLLVGDGVQVGGAQVLFVQDNLVQLVPENPLRDYRCGTVRYFRNLAPNGLLVCGQDGVSEGKRNELETDADLTLVLSLFKHH